MKISDYKHIIWDWNGTLFDDVELCCDIINDILTMNNLPKLTINKYREIFTFPVKDYYQKAGLDFNKTPFEILGQQFIEKYESRKYECSLNVDTESVLQKIQTLKIEQSILSAYSQISLDQIVSHYNIRNYFVGLAGLDNIYANGKIELGKRWMQSLNLTKGEALLIGDTLHDFEVASEIGADCLLVASGHQNKNSLITAETNVIDTLEELNSLF